jgi:methylase of polypeptide subunit release factors
VETLFKDNGYQQVQVRSDLAGRDRVVYGQKPD